MKRWEGGDLWNFGEFSLVNSERSSEKEAVYITPMLCYYSGFICRYVKVLTVKAIVYIINVIIVQWLYKKLFVNLFNFALLSLKEGERVKGLFWSRTELQNTSWDSLSLCWTQKAQKIGFFEFCKIEDAADWNFV